MFTTVLFTITKKHKQPKCPSTDGWVKKMWFIHTMKYYGAFKRKKTLQYATTWMNLGDIMIREVNQSQKNKYCMIPFL